MYRSKFPALALVAITSSLASGCSVGPTFPEGGCISFMGCDSSSGTAVTRKKFELEIRGTVVSAVDGAPVAGATVELQSSGSPPFTSETDEEGKLVIEAVRYSPDRCFGGVIYVTAEGFRQAWSVLNAGDDPICLQSRSPTLHFALDSLPPPSVEPLVAVGKIEWDFGSLDRPVLPDPLIVTAGYSGFYNDAPCDKAATTLVAVSVPWNTTGITHRYDSATDPGFAGFVQCMLNGSNETLELGITDVSGWAVRESIALDTGRPDLAGHSIEYIEMVVDQAVVSDSVGGYNLDIVMRWIFHGR